jgi:hypothetical protein
MSSRPMIDSHSIFVAAYRRHWRQIRDDRW